MEENRKIDELEPCPTASNSAFNGGLSAPTPEPFGTFPPGSFPAKLEELINCYSIENGSNTPDFILAEYLRGCLENFDMCVRRREEWYGR